MKKILTFESFLDNLEFEKYLYLVEDIILLEEPFINNYFIFYDE